MISKKMKGPVANNSAVKEMFEEGKRLEKIYGKENVYDFSLGNPSIPAPKKVNEAIKEIIENDDPLEVHGYTNNAGFEDIREILAKSINKRFNTNFNKENFIMTVGAASGLNIVFKSILNPEDEVIVFAPYFMEYNNYINGYDGKVVTISPNITTFQPNLDEFKKKITPQTKAVLINTPNNPTGVIYSENTIKEIANILEEKEKEYNHEIFLISDEPYRELAFDNKNVPFITKYYKNTFIVYSYSKSLSLPGERIGYVIVPDEMEDSKTIQTAITIANRIIGCVNAPSLMQKVIVKCLDEQIDLHTYNYNRQLLYNSLTKLGFECVKPEGAFYLFVKSPINDDKEFCKHAKKFNLLFVPGTSFACPGYVRIAYCVSSEMLEKSLDAFKKLADIYFSKLT